MALDAIANFFNSIIESFKNFLTSIANASTLIAATLDEIRRILYSRLYSFEDFLNTMNKALKSLWDALTGLPSQIEQAFKWFMSMFLDFLKEAWNGLVTIFTQVYDMITSAMTSIIGNIQCALTGVYRKIRERIPILLAYNTALMYTRRIINKGRPRDFLKLIPMSLMAGFGGVALASLLPDVPSDRCLEITPFPIASVTEAFRPPKPVPVERTVSLPSLVDIKDSFLTFLLTSTVFYDTVTVKDISSFATPSSQAFFDEIATADSFTSQKAGLAGSTDRISIDDMFRASAVMLSKFADTVSITDASEMVILSPEMPSPEQPGTVSSGSTETPMMSGYTVKDHSSGSTQTPVMTGMSVKDVDSGSAQTPPVTVTAAKSEEIESGSSQSATACVNIDQLNVESCPNRL